MSSTSTVSGLPRAAACSTSVAEMAFHVAAIVQAGQRVGDRHLDRQLDVVAQPLGVALLADLGAHARQQFVLVDRPHQIVVDADLEPAHQARVVVGLGRSPGSARCGCARASGAGCTAAARRNSPGRATRSSGRNCPRRRGTAPRSDRSRRRPCARPPASSTMRSYDDARSSTIRMRPGAAGLGHRLALRDSGCRSRARSPRACAARRSSS